MEKEFLFKVMYVSILQIRELAHESNDMKIFSMSKFIHNLPLQLLQAETEEDFQKLFEEYKQKAKDYGVEKWFDSSGNINTSPPEKN